MLSDALVVEVVRLRLTAVASLQLFLYICSICPARRNSKESYALVAWKSSDFWGCIRQSVISRSREVILLCSGYERHIWSSGSWAGLPSTRETSLGILEQGQRRAMKVVKGLEHMTYKERVQHLRLLSLE